MAKKNKMKTSLEPSEYLELSRMAAKIFGCVSQLSELRNRPLPVETIRDLCSRIYTRTDEFLERLETMEKD